MCLLAIAWKTHPRWRLLLAGNRDELHARPTAALADWADNPGLRAGRDLQSGGTWAGVDASGRMAVVTNVRDPSVHKANAPSRGRLVTDFLGGQDDAAAHARGLLPRAAAYAPFNLLLADDDTCQYVGNTPTVRGVRLSAGIHGLSNGDLDEPWPKTVLLQRRLAAWIDAGDPDPAALWQALADDTAAADDALPDTGVGLALERMLSPAFIRSARYGTRASTLIAIDHDGRGWIAERRFGPEGAFQGETRLPIGANA